MVEQKVSRLTDIGIGICTCHSPPQVYTTTFITGSPTVFVDELNVAIIGTIGTSTCGHPTVATTGSTISFAREIPIHRVGDTGHNCGPYVTMTGSDNVRSE